MSYITLSTPSPFSTLGCEAKKKKALALFHHSGLRTYSLLTIRAVLAPGVLSRSMPALCTLTTAEVIFIYVRNPCLFSIFDPIFLLWRKTYVHRPQIFFFFLG